MQMNHKNLLIQFLVVFSVLDIIKVAINII